GGGVAERDGDVAQPAGVAAATDRGALGPAQELVLLPGEQLGQGGPVQVVADPEVGLVVAARELVPGAGELAVVAAEDAVAHQRPQRLVDRALVLDGQVADAAARVEQVGRHDRAGRAHLDAARAAAAVRGGRRIWGQG